MPSPATATATAAQTRAAGTRMLGFYEGVGGVKVDALIDPANFITRTAAGNFLASATTFAGTVPTAGAVDGATSLYLTNGLDIAYGLNIGVAGNGNSWLQCQRNDGAATTYNLLLNPLGGNVGIGTPSAAARLHAKSGGEIARFETATARGGGQCYIAFADPAGSKGFSGYSAVDDGFDIWNSLNAPIRFGANGAYRWQVSPAGALHPSADNAYPIGTASFRATLVYAVTGTINTCDIRLKFYRAESAPTADEHAAALECFEAFGFFQHLDAIERENDGGAPSRWHFGPMAQVVWMIFAARGLAAPLGEDGLPPEGSVPPAFLCFDVVPEETAPVMAWWRPSDILGGDGQPIMVPCAEGEEGIEQRPTGETYVVREAGNIFGIRVDQLQSLMLVALNKERLAHAADIAALRAEIAALGAGA